MGWELTVTSLRVGLCYPLLHILENVVLGNGQESVMSLVVQMCVVALAALKNIWRKLSFRANMLLS